MRQCRFEAGGQPAKRLSEPWRKVRLIPRALPSPPRSLSFADQARAKPRVVEDDGVTRTEVFHDSPSFLLARLSLQHATTRRDLVVWERGASTVIRRHWVTRRDLGSGVNGLDCRSQPRSRSGGGPCTGKARLEIEDPHLLRSDRDAGPVREDPPSLRLEFLPALLTQVATGHCRVLGECLFHRLIDQPHDGKAPHG